MGEWKVENIATLANGKKTIDISTDAIYPIYGGNGIMGYSNSYNASNVIIIGRVGAYCGSVHYSREKCWISDNAISVRTKDSNNIEYLYYLLLSLNLNRYHIGGAQPLMTQGIINNIDIPKYSIPEQKKIASILSSLDNKIETNRKINARLEELAQALFKSWFIDFEPFGGKMPEDWKVSVAEDFFKIDIGKTPPRKETQWFSNNANDITWVSISDMGKQGMFISSSSEMITEDAVNKFNIVIVPPNTILLSFKLTIGRVSIADRQLATNEAIARFKLNKPSEREYLYLFLKEFDYNSLGCTSSIAMAVNSKIIKRMPIVMPNDETLYSFNKLACPLFDRIRSLDKESSRLAALRDTLLPKLMSGELIPE